MNAQGERFQVGMKKPTTCGKCQFFHETGQGWVSIIGRCKNEASERHPTKAPWMNVMNDSPPCKDGGWA